MAEQSTRSFSAVAENIELGKTRGSFMVVAEVNKNGGIYSVLISASPLAMPDEQPRPVLQFSLDTTQYVFSRNTYKDVAASIKSREIFDILNLFKR